MPRGGDAVEVAGLRIAVSARRGRRVVEVVVTRVPLPAAEGAHGPGAGGPQAAPTEGGRP